MVGLLGKRSRRRKCGSTAINSQMGAEASWTPDSGTPLPTESVVTEANELSHRDRIIRAVLVSVSRSVRLNEHVPSSFDPVMVIL